MNIEQKLLFSRVGLTTQALGLICAKIEPNMPSDRTLRTWFSGEKTPKNPYYVDFARSLDKHLTEKANYIVGTHDSNILILPYYANDIDYLERTDEFMPVSVYYQLVQRIIMLANQLDMTVIIDVNNEHLQDWGNYVALDVGMSL